MIWWEICKSSILGTFEHDIPIWVYCLAHFTKLMQETTVASMISFHYGQTMICADENTLNTDTILSQYYALKMRLSISNKFSTAFSISRHAWGGTNLICVTCLLPFGFSRKHKKEPMTSRMWIIKQSNNWRTLLWEWALPYASTQPHCFLWTNLVNQSLS